MTVRIFSRLPSVAPTHFERKFFSLMVVSPHSLANASATKVLPVPIGPGEEDAHRARGCVRALADVLGDHAAGPSSPPPCRRPPRSRAAGSTNSIRPKHSRSRISRLRRAMSRSTSRRARSRRRRRVAGACRRARAACASRRGCMPGGECGQLVGARSAASARAAEELGDERLALARVVLGRPAAAPGWPRSASLFRPAVISA